MRTSEIVWLDEVGEDDRARVGSKAFHLARLRRAGLPVPEGFVLPEGATDFDRLGHACARLGAAVAVRSSSADEDTAERSFAGQYRTELDVRGLEAVRAAVGRCRAALAQADAYTRAVGAPPARPPSILVQRFVEPLHAGVAFTRHPREPGALLIEAHCGRGEAVASGAVTPDRYVVDRATGSRREPETGSSALSPAFLSAIASLALRAEDVLGGPQDVEWAIGPDGPVVLQSRPITVEDEEVLDPRILRLTRANVGEVLPDPVTPLTATTVVALLEHAFQTVVALAGLDEKGGAPFLVLYGERLYLNLSRSLEIAARLPGVGPEDAERLVLGGGAGATLPSVGLRAWPRLLVVARRLLALDAGLRRDIDRAAGEVARLRARAGRATTVEELAQALDAVFESGPFVATTHVATSGASAVRLALLTRALSRWCPGDASARLGRLMGGLDDVESAGPAATLDALAAESSREPSWRAWLERPAADSLRGFEGDDMPPALRQRLVAFLDRYGHRGLSEGELLALSWREDPGPVLAALRALMGAGAPPGLHSRAAAAARRAEEEGALFRLGPLRRTIAQWAIREAQEWVRARERTKSIAVEMVDAARRVARRAGACLADRGEITRAGDVFFLTADELRKALRGGNVSAAALVRRRRRFARAAGVPARREIDFRAGASDGEDVGMRWRGIGVSGGIGLGRARVAAAGEAPALAPGEILVAPVLDAALGPLLSSAAGAVIEIGGMLSHGAVVARELGIPCVVDVRGATSAIKDGDRLLIDGGSGEVRRLEDVAMDGAAPTGSAFLDAVTPSDDAFHVLEDHPLARESVYVNAQDPARGLHVVASAGVRGALRGEALLALGLPDGRVLFALDRKRAAVSGSAIRVGGFEATTAPASLRFAGRMSVHEDGAFPPGALPLLLAPRTAEVTLDLRLVPDAPAFDFVHQLDADRRALLAPLGAHHIEQSGRWAGKVEVDGHAFAFLGPGSRDHSWGRRQWDAAESWRLFTFALGREVVVHALTVIVAGRRLDGGFVWRAGRAEPVARVLFAPRTPRPLAFDLEVTPMGGHVLRVLGTVERRLTVPVDPERALGRHLAGRPWRLRLHENFTRYEGEGHAGHGMAEITERG